MPSLKSASILGSEFDDFLFAPIAAEKSGMLLRVISALARLDLDPWQETANLAQMTRPAATERLREFIISQPDILAAELDPEAIAIGLIARLPENAASDTNSIFPGNVVKNQPHLLFFLALGLMFLLEAVTFASSRPSAANINGAALQPSVQFASRPPAPNGLSGIKNEPRQSKTGLRGPRP